MAFYRRPCRMVWLSDHVEFKVFPTPEYKVESISDRSIDIAIGVTWLR